MKNERRRGAPTELSVVIPTYNRSDLVIRAIQSALHIDGLANMEVVIVDDHSSDDTVELVRREFRKELQTGVLRLLCNRENLGVTGAKNSGAAAALGEWIIFLDSDDVLRKESLAALVQELRNAGETPVVFFRCVDAATGALIGRKETSRLLVGLQDILRCWQWGECLPAVRRGAFERFRYDADLRGFEGLAYCRITRALGPVCLSTVVARTYSTVGPDRLSSRAGLRSRSCDLARGHLRMLQEFFRPMGVRCATGRLARICLYTLRCIRFRVTP